MSYSGRQLQHGQRCFTTSHRRDRHQVESAGSQDDEIAGAAQRPRETNSPADVLVAGSCGRLQRAQMTTCFSRSTPKSPETATCPPSCVIPRGTGFA